MKTIKPNKQITIDEEKFILDAIVDGWRDIEAGRIGTLGNGGNSCVLAGNFARRILENQKVPHRLRPVGAISFNTKGFEMFGTNANDLPDDAWNVAVTRFSQDFGGWSGHLLVETDNFILDLTSEQFARPAKNIHVPSNLIVPMSDLKLFPLSDFGMSQERDSLRSRALSYYTQGHELRVSEFDWGVLAYFSDPTNLSYKTKRGWYRSWRELGCGVVVQNLNHRRKERKQVVSVLHP
jgi:hypothetical protein